MSRQGRMARKAWRSALRRWPDLTCYWILRRLHRHPVPLPAVRLDGDCPRPQVLRSDPETAECPEALYV